MSLTKSLNEYYKLTKPGIVRGNAFTAVAGFFLASQGNINWVIFFAATVGLSLIVASGCVFNNYIDRGIDEKMERTKNRALVKARIKPAHALIYATFLVACGLFLLGFYANILTMFIAFIGFFFYVIVYGYFKRKSVHGTLVGSIPGSIPPVVGYCSVTGRLDVAAAILFLILVCWQMAHFYAIGMYRAKDYAAAGLPILPVKSGFESTKRQILFYIVAFIVAGLLLTLYGYAGYTYAAVIILLGAYWLKLGLQKINAANDRKWSGKMFGFSIVVLTTLSVVIGLDHWLP